MILSAKRIIKNVLDAYCDFLVLVHVHASKNCKHKTQTSIIEGHLSLKNVLYYPATVYQGITRAYCNVKNVNDDETTSCEGKYTLRNTFSNI